VRRRGQDRRVGNVVTLSNPADTGAIVPWSFDDGRDWLDNGGDSFDKARVWSAMLAAIEERGPLLRCSAGLGISGVSPEAANEYFAVLYGAGLVEMHGNGCYVTATTWRETIRDLPSPPDVHPEAWTALRELTERRFPQDCQ